MCPDRIFIGLHRSRMWTGPDFGIACRLAHGVGSPIWWVTFPIRKFVTRPNPWYFHQCAAPAFSSVHTIVIVTGPDFRRSTPITNVDRTGSLGPPLQLLSPPDRCRALRPKRAAPTTRGGTPIAWVGAQRRPRISGPLRRIFPPLPEAGEGPGVRGALSRRICRETCPDRIFIGRHDRDRVRTGFRAREVREGQGSWSTISWSTTPLKDPTKSS
jgi:hypothetical protein